LKPCNVSQQYILLTYNAEFKYPINKDFEFLNNFINYAILNKEFSVFEGTVESGVTLCIISDNLQTQDLLLSSLQNTLFFCC